MLHQRPPSSRPSPPCPNRRSDDPISRPPRSPDPRCAGRRHATGRGSARGAALRPQSETAACLNSRSSLGSGSRLPHPSRPGLDAQPATQRPVRAPLKPVPIGRRSGGGAARTRRAPQWAPPCPAEERLRRRRPPKRGPASGADQRRMRRTAHVRPPGALHTAPVAQLAEQPPDRSHPTAGGIVGTVRAQGSLAGAVRAQQSRSGMGGFHALSTGLATARRMSAGCRMA